MITHGYYGIKMSDNKDVPQDGQHHTGHQLVHLLVIWPDTPAS
jgi:hypothetical protein